DASGEGKAELDCITQETDRPMMLILLTLLTLGSSQAPPPAGSAVINQYCVTCHNQRAKTAGLMLDTMDFDHVEKDPATWEKVVRTLKTGLMPRSGPRRAARAALARVAGER